MSVEEIFPGVYDITCLVAEGNNRYRAYLFDDDVPTLVDCARRDTTEALLKGIEESTEVTSIMSISITGRIAQFGSRMIEAVNNKLFDQFTQNFSTLMANQNREADANTNLLEAEPVKAASLVGSVVLSELKKKFGKKVE